MIAARSGAGGRWGKSNLYQAYLDHLDPRFEQPVLERLLHPIESAIIAATKHGEEFGGPDVDDALRDVVWEEEGSYIDELIGVAFVVLQVRVTRVATGFEALHTFHEKQGSRFGCIGLKKRTFENKEKGTRDNKKDRVKAVIAALSPPVAKTGIPSVVGVNAFANFFKHRDEWVGEWTALTGVASATASTVSVLGATRGSSGNLRQGAKALGVTDYCDLEPLRKAVECWHARLHEVHEDELRRGGFIK